MEDVAIKIDGVSKSFVLPHQRTGSIKDVFTSLLNRNKGYEKQTALKKIDLEIKKGEFFGIVGRNGSGKSTLLKIIAGIYQPTKGSVKVNGRLVPFIELGVGFSPELSGRDNVYLNGAMLGFSRKQVAEKYDRIVEFAELERFMGQKLKNYSSGMQVRLAFSVATILAESDILLIDEVLAVGDADFQRKCFDYFKQLKKQKKTVVFVTHDMNAVREFCDSAILIDRGRVAFNGSAPAAAREYTRLFASPHTYKTPQSKDGNDKKWGSSKAGYRNVQVSHTDSRIKIELQALSITDIPNPSFGFLIKNASGLQIFGTNSLVKQQKVEILKKNQPLEITWEFPNILSDGIHYIDLALTQEDGTIVHEWWEDAAKINIRKSEATPYPLTPDIKLTIR